jgi:hypothetical protein
MRTIALLLVVALTLVAFTGCCWNWNDPLHPRVCPVVHNCDGCSGCIGKPAHTRHYPYP